MMHTQRNKKPLPSWTEWLTERAGKVVHVILKRPIDFKQIHMTNTASNLNQFMLC